jgi:hypothetical protein
MRWLRLVAAPQRRVLFRLRKGRHFARAAATAPSRLSAGSHGRGQTSCYRLTRGAAPRVGLGTSQPKIRYVHPCSSPPTPRLCASPAAGMAGSGPLRRTPALCVLAAVALAMCLSQGHAQADDLTAQRVDGATPRRPNPPCPPATYPSLPAAPASSASVPQPSPDTHTTLPVLPHAASQSSPAVGPPVACPPPGVGQHRRRADGAGCATLPQ